MSRCTAWPLASRMVKAVYSKMDLIAFGVSGPPEGNAVRLASTTSAASPETTPADMLVPVSVRYLLLLSSRVGLLSTSRLSGAAGATILWPGATTSGLTKPSYQLGPRELHAPTVSSLRRLVPSTRSEPTVSDEGALAGEEMPPKPGRPVALLMPLFPAEETTRMPAFDAAWTACTSGSSAADSYGGWPSDRLMMSMPSAFLLTVANSTAAIRSLVLPPPVAVRTLSPTNDTPGATPR